MNISTAVVQVWNTFFPDSSWDDARESGFEGSQTVNIVVLCECEDLVMDSTAANEWAVTDIRWVSPEECTEVGAYDRYVSLNVASAIKSGLI